MSDDKKPNEDLSDFKIEVNLLGYRLTVIENKIDSSLENLSNKIDKIINHYSDTKSKQELANQSLDQLKESIIKIEERVLKCENELVALKVTLAEKLAFGGIGGGVAAVLIELITRIVEGT
jgi:chromosome segregation ATPase